MWRLWESWSASHEVPIYHTLLRGMPARKDIWRQGNGCSEFERPSIEGIDLVHWLVVVIVLVILPSIGSRIVPRGTCDAAPIDPQPI